MILEALKQLKINGVLGMNCRNSEYIMLYNDRSAFPLVDNKVLTKQLAQEYKIPTPPLYHIIKYHSDIREMDDALMDHSEFALKPARGAGGSGIVLITSHAEGKFIKPNGEVILRDDLNYHILGILSGLYSLEGLEDQVIIEGLIHPSVTFEIVTYHGVPDIRIVVYRGIPVMGMVRLPTKASDGKANLHRGAIGAGIDMDTGTTLTAVQRSKVVTHHPDTGNPVNNIKIPYWKDMLLMAAKAVEMTGLGYVGVDLVIDRDHGPMLLELNARPGLAIQLANRAGLRKRLRQIDEVSQDVFETAESRIEWAMQKFNAG